MRMCAHPAFSCNIMLDGHEWVENHKQTARLAVTKESNCFTSYDPFQLLLVKRFRIRLPPNFILTSSISCACLGGRMKSFGYLKKNLLSSVNNSE